MIVEERVQKFFNDDDVEWLGSKRVKRLQERMAQLLRDQIEDCAKVAQEYHDAGEQREGCDLCELAGCIVEEIRALAGPETGGNAMKRVPENQSVLPMLIVDQKNQVLEEIICVGISGGADYVEGMPRRLSLMRFKNGVKVGWAEYEFKETLNEMNTPQPESKGD
jgi:hypothetical protein